MKFLAELYQLITERFGDSLDHEIKSVANNLALEIDKVTEFKRRMANEHDADVAHRLAMGRFAKWFASNYQSSRSTSGLRELFRYIANNASGNLRQQAMHLANLPTYALPDKKTGSKGLVSNAMDIIEKLPSMLRAFGASKNDKSFDDFAHKIEQAWNRFEKTSIRINPDKKRDSMDRENRELDRLRGVQNMGAERIVNDTIERIPDKRIRSVIRDEVMRSGNKLATLDRMLTHFGIKF